MDHEREFGLAGATLGGLEPQNEHRGLLYGVNETLEALASRTVELTIRLEHVSDRLLGAEPVPEMREVMRAPGLDVLPFERNAQLAQGFDEYLERLRVAIVRLEAL